MKFNPNTHAIYETLETILSSKSPAYLFRKSKPFTQCYDLDDAFEEFRQMGFNAVMLEVEHAEASPSVLSDYVLVVGDCSFDTHEHIGVEPIVETLSKLVNEKPLLIWGGRIENTLQEMGLNPKKATVLGVCDARGLGRMRSRWEEQRARFLSLSSSAVSQEDFHEQS